MKFGKRSQEVEENEYESQIAAELLCPKEHFLYVLEERSKNFARDK